VGNTLIDEYIQKSKFVNSSEINALVLKLV